MESAKAAVAADRAGDYATALPMYMMAIEDLMSSLHSSSDNFALEQRVRGYFDRAEAIKVHLAAEQCDAHGTAAAVAAAQRADRRPLPAQSRASAQRSYGPAHGRVAYHAASPSLGGFAPAPFPPRPVSVARATSPSAARAASARAAAARRDRDQAREHMRTFPTPSPSGSSSGRRSSGASVPRTPALRQTRLASETWIAPSYRWKKRIALRSTPRDGAEKIGGGSCLDPDLGPWRTTHRADPAASGSGGITGVADGSRWFKVVGVPNDRGVRTTGWVREKSVLSGKTLLVEVRSGGGSSGGDDRSGGGRRRGLPQGGSGASSGRPRGGCYDGDAQPLDLDVELAKIIGLNPIKQQLRDLRDSILLDRERAELMGDGFEFATLAPHMVFCGNPGVGKVRSFILLSACKERREANVV